MTGKIWTQQINLDILILHIVSYFLHIVNLKTHNNLNPKYGLNNIFHAKQKPISSK